MKTTDDYARLVDRLRETAAQAGHYGAWSGGVLMEQAADVLCQMASARHLLKRASAQLLAWNDLYGRVSTTVLPPAGDVRLAEDIDEFLRPNEK